MDNLLQISMPSTPLTSILKDFRSYRPGNHRQFLEWINTCATLLSLKSYALAFPASAALYLRALDQVREFRWRHWCFTREYILKRTSHPTATGGSPIVTWLPNQLGAVLEGMVEVGKVYEEHGWRMGKDEDEILELVERQKEGLRKEMEKWCQERGVQN